MKKITPYSKESLDKIAQILNAKKVSNWNLSSYKKKWKRKDSSRKSL